jgi:hypothetical protein
VTGPSTECYFEEFLLMWVFTHDEIGWINGCERSECHGVMVSWCHGFVLGLPPRGGFLKVVQVTMKT